jgi:hypothetical protein
MSFPNTRTDSPEPGALLTRPHGYNPCLPLTNEDGKAASKKPFDKEPKPVRKSVPLDPDKLARARTRLRVASNAEVLRIALGHLLEHFSDHPGEEE